MHYGGGCLHHALRHHCNPKHYISNRDVCILKKMVIFYLQHFKQLSSPPIYPPRIKQIKVEMRPSSLSSFTVQTRYQALHARMSHRTGASKTCLYISDHRRKHFYVSDETKASHVRANVPRYNKRLYESICIQFKARYEAVAICKKLTRIYINI